MCVVFYSMDTITGLRFGALLSVFEDFVNAHVGGLCAVFNRVGWFGVVCGGLGGLFGQQHAFVGVDNDVAVGIHFIEELIEFGAREVIIATGIIESESGSWIFANKPDNFLVKGGVIFFLALFLRRVYHINIT